MNGNFKYTVGLLIVLALGGGSAAAQFNIKLPDIKIKKTEKDPTKNKENNTTATTPEEVKTNRADKLVYEPQLPTDVPQLIKNSIYVQAKVRDEYWKMPGQRDFSSWVPLIRFNQYYTNVRDLNYTVEYFNPDGSAWYSEKLESQGRNADRTVLYKSPSPYGGVFDTKATNGTGVYSFRITDQDTKEVLFAGKFKVGKFSRAYRPEEKNKFDFYVEHDWLLPFATIAFHFSLDRAGAMPPLVNVWFKGPVEKEELEARIFYKGRQVASTKDDDGASGANPVEERASDYAAAFQQGYWRQWQFQWGNFRFDNNGSFNRDYFPKAHYADKNPGDYTIKIYRNGAQVRELGFTIGADGRIVVPGYSSQLFMPYYGLTLPVKMIGAAEKWDAAAWKTEAFYANPVSGFTVQ